VLLVVIVSVPAPDLASPVVPPMPPRPEALAIV
jgi:hypothetical protein